MWQILLAVLAIYFLVGVLFALAFHVAGLRRADAGVENAGVVFRLLITPGLVGLWPLMALKWLAARRGEATAGPVETPLTPRGLRSTHRRLALSILVVVPVLATAAIVSRPSPPPVEAAPLERAAQRTNAELPTLVAVVEQPFPDLPAADAVRVEVRTDGSRYQLVAEVAEDLEIPDLALYLAPTHAATAAPAGAQFLGTLWGPHVHRYPLPAGFDPDAGWALKLYSLSHREFVAVNGLGL